MSESTDTNTWFELSFVVGQEEADALSDALLEAGALSVEVLDDDAGTAAEKPVFEEPDMPVAPIGWQSSKMVVLCADEAEGRRLIAEALTQQGLAAPAQVHCKAIPHQDWVSLTQSQFEPISIGSRLWITPSWHADDAAQQPPDSGRQTIVLDPGMAFGTGSHPTTRLCLSWLDQHLQGGESVIDYGCGSGILAIAAAKLGASHVHGVDIDDEAVASAGRNAADNQVSLTLSSTREPAPVPARIVLANILASPLKVLAPALEALVEPGGFLVLAGLLDDQVAEVAACYRQIDMKAWRSEEGWTCLAGQRAGGTTT